jgi:hypothetical protein
MTILVQNQPTKKFGPFSALFWLICQKFGRRFSRPHTIFFGPFCGLQPKFRPLRNTVTCRQCARRLLCSATNIAELSSRVWYRQLNPAKVSVLHGPWCTVRGEIQNKSHRPFYSVGNCFIDLKYKRQHIDTAILRNICYYVIARNGLWNQLLPAAEA